MGSFGDVNCSSGNSFRNDQFASVNQLSATDGVHVDAVSQATQVKHLLSLVAVQLGRHHRNSEGVGYSECSFGRLGRQGIIHRCPCSGGIGAYADTEAHGFVHGSVRGIAYAPVSTITIIGHCWARVGCHIVFRDFRQYGFCHCPGCADSICGDAVHHRPFGFCQLEDIAVLPVEGLV